MAAALLGFSMAPVHAVSLTPDLTFDGSYSEDLQILSYEFETLSTNNVSIWMDTLQDGLDARGALFVKNDATGAWDWVVEVLDADQSDYSAALNYNTSGFNDFGVKMKNGYEQNSVTKLGESDPGANFSGLSAGHYLFAVTHQDHQSNASKNGGGTLSQGFFDGTQHPIFAIAISNDTWTTDDFYTGSASPFQVFVTGDVANVSAVPVPAAVWLFSSALTGLGLAQRRKKRLV